MTPRLISKEAGQLWDKAQELRAKARSERSWADCCPSIEYQARCRMADEFLDEAIKLEQKALAIG